METKEIIERIYALNTEVQDLRQKDSDLYKKALEARENKIVVLNEKEEEVEVTEGEMWEEIRVLSQMGQYAKRAIDVLKPKYPELFEASELVEAKNKELHDFIQEQLGFSFRQMGIADYMKLTEMLIDYKAGK